MKPALIKKLKDLVEEYGTEKVYQAAMIILEKK